MTNEEAIKQLKKCKSFHNGSYGAAINLAIKALERQPNEDCISREAVFQIFDEACYLDGDWYVMREKIEKLPSVIPQQTTWIPLNVKGNEPKEEGHYLLYFDYGYVIVFYYDGRNGDLWADAIAYMPLPEPYKAESEVEDESNN